jgi:hypothetical protein
MDTKGMRLKRRLLGSYILSGVTCVAVATVVGFWNSDYPGKIEFGIVASIGVAIASIPYVTLAISMSPTSRTISLAFWFALVPYTIATYLVAIAISRMS